MTARPIATQEISEGYKYVRLINQENQGLSAARNVGLRAATGDIIAYTDCDCMVDPDWLMHLVARFLTSDFGAVGGPNLPPPDNSMVANCVAVSPGAPAHVLLDDEVAEHIPGCNMAFRREALEAIDGFDPLFRAAGDDVDVCWRLQNKGYKIGFSAAAVVWHFRRNTVRDYVKQQEGYGKAEALLYFKHPTRFQRAWPVAMVRQNLRRPVFFCADPTAENLLGSFRPRAYSRHFINLHRR